MRTGSAVQQLSVAIHIHVPLHVTTLRNTATIATEVWFVTTPKLGHLLIAYRINVIHQMAHINNVVRWCSQDVATERAAVFFAFSCKKTYTGVIYLISSSQTTPTTTAETIIKSAQTINKQTIVDSSNLIIKRLIHVENFAILHSGNREWFRSVLYVWFY